MQKQPITLSEQDAQRLRALLDAPQVSDHDRGHRDELEAELERARIIDAAAMPPDVVAVDADITVLDLGSRQRRALTLVWPRDSAPEAGRVSVLAPLGIALLGQRADDEVTWRMPGGLQRLRIESVQPARRGAHGPADGRRTT